MNIAETSVILAERDYLAFLNRLKQRFLQVTDNGQRPVFTTDAGDLVETYLSSFDLPEVRQHHDCHACRDFLRRYGSLVVIDESGRTAPAIWYEDDADALYQPAVAALAKAVRRAKVTGVFMSKESVWGTPQAGGWRHLSLAVPEAMRYRNQAQTAGQSMAEKREDMKNVTRALSEFNPAAIETAVRILMAGHLYSGERVLGQAKWLEKLHAKRAAAADANARRNVTWLAVATAPAGFCHPRSSMIGTLLEDIAAGMPFDTVARRFADKMHPLRHQRPQAAPAAGNIAQAQKLFETLGLAPALERRIARFDEVPKTWEPKAFYTAKNAVGPADGKVFGHLTPKGRDPLNRNMTMPRIRITLEKFVREVVESAESIDVLLEGPREKFIVITTAVNPDSPPIFQWDHPFAWYVWNGGANPAQFGLTLGWAKVSGITRLPARWNDDGERFKHQGDGIILMLEGAAETHVAGAALFPALLRSDLHGVRATIEAHSNTSQMRGLADGSAIGIDVRASNQFNPVKLRVTSKSHVQEYIIDRWD